MKNCEKCGKQYMPSNRRRSRFCSRFCQRSSMGEGHRAPLADRFWAKVSKHPGGCWEWLGAKTSHGYGQISLPGRIKEGAHRVAWQLTHGQIPNDLCVLHRCDNRRCVRSDHLFLGTYADNNLDMRQKGRDRHRCHRGEAHPNAKLTTAMVVAIRAYPGSAKEIAAKYGVAKHNVYAVRAYRVWRHV